jgi:hypothetical protein
MGGPFLDDEDPAENPLKDFGVHGGGIPVPPQRKVATNLRRPTRRPFDEPTTYAQEDKNHMLDFAMNMAQQGFANHANAANQINSAIAKEMDSRVAQEREMRRMEHEKELARMRMQMERDKTEAMIRRLEQERDPMPPGMISRIRIDGKGRVTHG